MTRYIPESPMTGRVCIHCGMPLTVADLPHAEELSLVPFRIRYCRECADVRQLERMASGIPLGAIEEKR